MSSSQVARGALQSGLLQLKERLPAAAESSSFLAVLAAIAITSLCTVLSSHKLISALLDPLLSYSNRIYSTDGKRQLDGPRFTWPHGNGKQQFTEPRNCAERWSKQYGKIYRIWGGTYSEVVISTPEDVAKFYSDATSHVKTLAHRTGWIVNNVMGDCVGLAHGERWRTMRKHFDPILANGLAVKQIPHLNAAGREFVSRLDAFKSDVGPSKGSFVIPAAKALMAFPLIETTQVFLGEMSAAEQKELLDIGQIYIVATQTILPNGPFRRGIGYWMHTPFEYGVAREFLRRWSAFNQKIADSRRDRPDLPITKLWKSVKEGVMTQKQLLQTITESTYTNLDVTAYVIVSTCLLLADDKKVQDELVAEIDSNRENFDAYIGRKDTLLHFAFLEALRVQPVLPFTLSEASPVDKELGGYHIPKGTSIITDSYGVNIRNPYWGPDSRKYRPMRFKGLTPRDLLFNLNLFGFGARKCMGQYFADKQLRSIVLHLFDRYQVSIASQLDPAFATDKSTTVDMFNVEFKLQPRLRG